MGDMECEGIVDTDWLDHHSSDEDSEDDFDRVGGMEPVKFFTNELSCRGRLHRLLISNPTSRIYSAVFDLVVKVLICALYVIRVLYDDHRLYACEGHKCSSPETEDPNSPVFTSTNINWHVIVWVHRPLALWVLQVILCLLTTSKAVLYVCIATKHSVCDQILTTTFLLEMVCSLPLLVTMFYPVMLKDFFVPLFLHCWLAKGALRRLMNDLHLTKQKFQTLSVTLNQQICFVTVTIICIIFTTICGIQHIQRSSAHKPLNMFEAVYFVIVTFSTVGYGDISPDIWLGQLFMLLMICVAFAFIPKQIEEIGSTWAQKKKTGGDYGKNKAEKGKHVVVYASSFSADVVMNFLNEFYEHPKLEDHTVILMSSEELDSNMLFILKDPKWAHRVVYIRGSPLKDIDLKRCRINNAESVFFLRDKKCPDQEKADQHTILRSWAVKDFAPDCFQYVQLFKATNKQHIRFAEHVVCEDEFKFALLANNCLYPGLSTLVTLILYTSRGKEGQLAKEPWQRVYGRHSGNEIYHIQLSKSVFFNRYEGRTFLQASAEVHDKLGVCLLAVLDSTNSELRLKLNPGPDYILKGSDYCFYMSLTKEEYSEVTMLLEQELTSPLSLDDDSDGSTFPLLSMAANGSEDAEDVTLKGEPIKSGSEERDGTCTADRICRLLGDTKKDCIMAGPLPNSMPVGTKRIICHLYCEPRPVCCVLWGVDCEHCTFKNAGDARWRNQLVILSVKECSPALYNFIIPLRSSYLSLGSLYPVVILVDEEPDSLFLETIAHFPLVFWMKGSLKSLDDLLKAGIHQAIHLVISNIGATVSTAGYGEGLEDAETIVMVQKITRLFPSVNIMTEMKEDSNMRFMHFQAHDLFTQEISRLEKRLKEKTVSNVSYMFRPPFAAGQVFSTAMLDRLLYQTFVKGYLICFVRLLLGIDAQKRSGHLSSVHVTRAMTTELPTYGDLYQSLCSTTGEIPIALYRTERRPGLNLDIQQSLLMGNNNALSIQKGRPSIGSALFQKVEDYGNVAGFINNRLEHLQLGREEAYVTRKTPRTLSYVIVNPSPSYKLKNGDMIYVIQPSSMQASPRKLNPQNPPGRFKRCGTTLSQMFEPLSSKPGGVEPPNTKSSLAEPCKVFPRSPSQVRWNLDSCSDSPESVNQPENLNTLAEERNLQETGNLRTVAEERNSQETVNQPGNLRGLAEERNSQETVNQPGNLRGLAEERNSQETVNQPGNLRGLAEERNLQETVNQPGNLRALAEERNSQETVNQSENLATPAEDRNSQETVNQPGNLTTLAEGRYSQETVNQPGNLATPAEDRNSQENVNQPENLTTLAEGRYSQETVNQPGNLRTLAEGRNSQETVNQPGNLRTLVEERNSQETVQPPENLNTEAVENTQLTSSVSPPNSHESSPLQTRREADDNELKELVIQENDLQEQMQGDSEPTTSAVSPQLSPKTSSNLDFCQLEEEVGLPEDLNMLKKESPSKSVSWVLLAEDAEVDV